MGPHRGTASVLCRVFCAMPRLQHHMNQNLKQNLTEPECHCKILAYIRSFHSIKTSSPQDHARPLLSYQDLSTIISSLLSGHDFNTMSDFRYPASLLVSCRYFSLTLGPWYDTSHYVRLVVPRQVLSTTLQLQHQIPPQRHFSSCQKLTSLLGPRHNIRLPVSYKDLSIVLDPSIISGTQHQVTASVPCGHRASFYVLSIRQNRPSCVDISMTSGHAVTVRAQHRFRTLFQ